MQHSKVRSAALELKILCERQRPQPSKHHTRLHEPSNMLNGRNNHLGLLSIRCQLAFVFLGSSNQRLSLEQADGWIKQGTQRAQV